MPCRMGLLVCLFCLCGLLAGKAQAAPPPPAAIACDKGHSALEKLAAKELRRYIYLRTGSLLPIIGPGVPSPAGSLILVTTKKHLLETGVSPDAEDAKLNAEVEGLKPQQFLLKTWKRGDRTVLLVVGGDPLGTLYGAYRLAEHLARDSTCTATCCRTNKRRWKCRSWTKPASRSLTAAASSRSTISPRGPIGGAATATKPFSASCRRWG